MIFVSNFCQILNVFWPIQDVIVVGEPFCDLDILNENDVVGYRCDSYWGTLSEEKTKKCVILGVFIQFRPLMWLASHFVIWIYSIVS